MATRKGARRIADIPPELLAALNCGEAETVSLVEGLAIDMVQLADAVVPEIADTARAVRNEGVMARSRALGAALRESPRRDELARHGADTVRCWACHAIVGDPALTLAERLTRARPFATDAHMGVREIAWLAARPFFADDLAGTIRLLQAWVRDDNANVRRFAVEGTRPRGVWCRHLPELKADPSPGLALLEPVFSDPSRYVQNAVGNWLNDAGKTQPEWVRDVCARWSADSKTRETAYIVRRALRSLRDA